MKYSHFEVMSWYFKPAIKFQLLPYFKGKEAALMIPKGFPHQERSTRMLRIGQVKDIDFLFNVTGFKSRRTLYNVFSSVATYKNGIPIVPYRLSERQDLKSSWKKIHIDNMKSYDLFIDIDGEHDTFEYTLKSAILIRDKLDEWLVPHRIRFSGKGFHFIIPYMYFEGATMKYPDLISFNPLDEWNIYWLYSSIATGLREQVSEMIDTSIYDARRLIKVPFSIAMYTEEFYICMPINTREELDDFDIRNYTLNHLKDKDIDLRWYGDKLYNKDGHIMKLMFETVPELKKG